MPITRKKRIAGAPTPAAEVPAVKAEEFSKARRVAAGVVRGATGLGGSLLSNGIGLGNVAAFGIAGAGDLLAQAIEEGDLNPLHQLDAASLKRAIVEGGMAAVPGKWLMVPGKLAKTALRSGVMAGGGEYAREKAKNEPTNPKAIIGSGIFGGLTGGALSKFFPAGANATPKPGAGAVADDIDSLLAGPHIETDEFTKKLPAIMHNGGWKGNLDKILGEANKLDSAGKPEFGQAVREVGLSNGYWDPKTIADEISRIEYLEGPEAANKLRLAAATTRRATRGASEKGARYNAEQAAKAEKKRQAALAKERTDELAANGTVKPSATRKVAGIDPETGETITYTETIKPKKPKKGAAPIQDDSSTGPVNPDGTPIDPNAPVGPNAPTATLTGPKVPMPPAKEGIYQVIAPASGRTWFETANPDELEAWLTKFGPNATLLKVIPPKVAAKTAAKPEVPMTTEPVEASLPQQTQSVAPVQPAAPVEASEGTSAAPIVTPGTGGSKPAWKIKRDAEAANLLAENAANEEKVLNELASRLKASGLAGEVSDIADMLRPRLAELNRMTDDIAGDIPDEKELLKFLAKEGGLSGGAETLGQGGETRWAKEFRDMIPVRENLGKNAEGKTRWGKIVRHRAGDTVNGVKGVFRESSKQVAGGREGGQTQASMLERIINSGKFPDITDESSLIEAFRVAATKKPKATSSGLDSLAQEVEQEIKDRAAELSSAGSGASAAEDSVVDILPTGEGQPRLPGAAGVRTPGNAPTFKLPVQSTAGNFNLANPLTDAEEAAKAAKLAAEAPALPGMGPDGVDVTNPVVGPKTVSEVESQLRTLAASGNKKAERALQQLIATGDEVAAKTEAVRILGSTPESVAPPVVPEQPRAADIPTIGKAPNKPQPVVRGGKIDYRSVLNDEEAQAVFEDIMRTRYADAGAPEAAEELIEASRAYRTAKAAGAAETDALGMHVGRTIPKRLELEGKIQPGFAKQVSDEIKLALQKAGEEKLAASMPIKSEPLANAGVLYEGPLPETGSGLSEAPMLPTEGPAVDVTNMSKEAPELLTGDMLPSHLENRVKAFMEGVESGKIGSAEATQLRTKLDEEIKAYFASKGSNAPQMTNPAAPIKGTPPGGSGSVLGSMFGPLQALRDNPQMAMKAASIAGGMILGGVSDPLDDPILSMALGGAAGIGGAKALSMLRQAHVNPANVPEFGEAMRTGVGFKEAVSGVMHLLPHFQRANYLWSAEGLGANAVAGPYGAGFFGALTKGLSGDSRGWAALKEFAPWNAASWVKEYQTSYQDAIELIQRVEAGDPLARSEVGGAAVSRILTGNSPAQKGARFYMEFPAWTMAAGDLATRKILMRSGFSEAEAREITLTAEPMIPTFKKFMDFKRGKPGILGDLMFPFVRTPLNILEQGLMKTPGIGFITSSIRENNGAVATSFRSKVVEQSMGAVIGSSAYMIGLMTPHEYSSTVRRYLSNGAGQYSALAAIGFAVGQGAQRTGGGPVAGALSPEAVRQLGYAFPTPTIEPITNWLTMAGQAYNGRPISTPPGIVPQQALDIQRYMASESPTTSMSIKGIGGIRRKIK